MASGPSSGTARGDFCQPWRGQAAARLNRRAATPNAVKDRDNNVTEDPTSGADRTHVPGVSRILAAPGGFRENAKSPTSSGGPVTLKVLIPPLDVIAETVQRVIWPVGPVAKRKRIEVALRSVIVCTPSENEKWMGVTAVNGLFAPSGLANDNIPDTKSLVV